jgi:tetratricopeptide (TPR) repeat protein
LAYNPSNAFASWLKIGVLFAKNKDGEQSKQLLIKELNKDTVSRFYLMQEVGKSYYFQRDYKNAYHYYKRFIAMKQVLHVDIYKNESLKIGIVLDKFGMKEESAAYFKTFKEYAFSDKSIYKSLNLMGYYAWLGEPQKAMEQMKLFSKEDNVQYWILFLADDPVFDELKKLPEFRQVMAVIEKKFWDNHKKIRSMLEEKGLL